MPELPEVETMVRGVRPHVLERTITEVLLPPCARKPIALTPKLRQMRTRSLDRKVVAVQRRAKRIVLELDSGDSFVIEPRMTGLMLVANPPTTAHLRFEWQLAGTTPLWFWDRRGLGTVSLYSVAEREAAFAHLGPEALEITREEFSARFGQTQRPIKVALLDQGLVAGVGNLYASEILFMARISPLVSSSRLKKPQRLAIYEAMHQVLEMAIEYEGSTLSDGTYRNVLAQDGGYQNQHRVYDREGLPCSNCNTSIRRIVQAQRSTFYCPECQRGRR